MIQRVLSSMSLIMPRPAHSSSFLLGLDIAKRREEDQIVDSFQGTCEDEGGTQRQGLEQGERKTQVGCEGDGRQQDVRGQMSEDHSVHEPNTPCQPGGNKERDGL